METALATTKLTGTAIVPVGSLTGELLEKHPKLILSLRNSASVILEQKSANTHLIICDSEDEADTILKEKEDFTDEVFGDEDETSKMMTTYVFNKEDMFQLLERNDEDIIEELAETLEIIGGRIEEINHKDFLKKVLTLREVYDISYIFRILQRMTSAELESFFEASDEGALFALFK